jgi:hypothetical protein
MTKANPRLDLVSFQRAGRMRSAAAAVLALAFASHSFKWKLASLVLV